MVNLAIVNGGPEPLYLAGPEPLEPSKVTTSFSHSSRAGIWGTKEVFMDPEMVIGGNLLLKMVIEI
jgi:hypothetical protein